jgi:hypothetical protein
MKKKTKKILLYACKEVGLEECFSTGGWRIVFLGVTRRLWFEIKIRNKVTFASIFILITVTIRNRSQ